MMLPEIKGHAAWVFEEENFDIDLIIGIENIKYKDVDKLKAVCMQNYDPDFAEYVEEGDVIIGGENFGYGHPHYPPFIALRALGIKAVFAESFAPGFHRGETNNGYPLIECPGIINHVSRGDTLEFNWETEQVEVVNKGITLQCNSISKKSRELITHGGVMGYLRKDFLNQ